MLQAKENIKYILFDMDGVLVDSEPVITAAAIQALREWEISAAPEDFKPFTGMGEDSFIGGVSRLHGVEYTQEMKARAYEIYGGLVRENIARYPSVPATLAALQQKGYTLALASAADLFKVRANLEAAEISVDTFRAVITGSDVARKKPYPDIYLLAAERVGAKPEECVVVEDAVSGLNAAHSAGMPCICVTTSFDRASLLAAGADAVIDDFGELQALL